MREYPTLVQLSVFTCAWCGKPLPKGRSHRKTHEGCRQKLFGWRSNQNRRGIEAERAIEMLGAYLNIPETRDLAVVQFEAVERKLIECYKIAGIARRNR